MITCLRICMVLILVTKIITLQISAETNVTNYCDRKLTCSECIKTNNCTWCVKPIMDSKPRCFNSSLTYCEKEYQWNPKSEHKSLSVLPLTRSGPAGSGEKQEDIVQISPQSIDLKLRINEEHRIQWQYAEIEDYDLDVYFLVELSYKMESDIENVLKLGDLLAYTLPNITSNYRLGLGSFVDKNRRPPVYAFKNHMSLTRNATKFIEELHKITVSNDSVAYGGGLEAIMQSMICRDDVDWSGNARRILVFSTNSGFHYAEDNLPANNDKCNLNTRVDRFQYNPRYRYHDEAFQDYPSIAQINSKVAQHQISVIFAVTSSQMSVYENLSLQVAGSSTAILSEDSSNVLELIRNEYNKITSYVEMNDDSRYYFYDFKITYSSSVFGQFEPIQSRRRDGLTTGDVVNFNADIVVTSCPQDESYWKRKFQIWPSRSTQSLIVNLEILCSCPCANNSAICELPVDCRLLDDALVDCSGRGTCVGGICECKKRRNRDEVISGQFCECDNFSCERSNGLLCSDHGTCSCGVCQCQPGWGGDACDCRKGNETCIRHNGEICSGHGTCECGACRCDVNEDGRFSGRFCEKCPTCVDRCEELKSCVQCQMYKTGPLSATEGMCAKNCTNIVTTEVYILEAYEEKDEHLCTFSDDDKCRFQFVYTDIYSGCNELEVRAQKERECPQKNQNELSYLTAKMLKHQEEYNFRLFRKGVLERGLESGIMIGNFKKLDNSYMKQAFISTSDNAASLANLKRRKTDDMNNELKRLKNEMNALDKRIGNIRLEVKSKTSKKIYEKWTAAIHDSTMKFQNLFSKNNELVYEISEDYEETFSSIINDVVIKYRNISELHKNHKERQGEKNGQDVEGGSYVQDDPVVEGEPKREEN